MIEECTRDEPRRDGDAGLDAQYAVEREHFVSDISQASVKEDEDSEVVAQVGSVLGYAVEDAVDADLGAGTRGVAPPVLYAVETTGSEPTQPEDSGIEEDSGHDVSALGVV